jgi:myo-inositol-1(or 4)-monophosphatase
MWDRVRQVGRQAALAAGALLKLNYEKPHDITLKSAIDPVTESDFAAQKTIISLIRQTFPDHEILAEERMDEEVGEGGSHGLEARATGRGPLPSPPHPLPQSLEGEERPEKAEPQAPPSQAPFSGLGGGSGGRAGTSGPWPSPQETRPPSYRWIIDPLDGTVNFAHGFPMFCVSIAFEAGGVLEYGVVYEPLRDELFEARRGEGAWLNGQPLKVSRVDRLNAALLATGFPYDIRERLPETLARMGRALGVSQGVRRAGSAALDLAYVAAGRLDGFWEENLKPWDTAAGVLLVTEAHGAVSTFTGEPYTLFSDNIAASNGRLHEALLKVL